VMAVMDSAIANVALPTIGIDLRADPALSIWIVNGYQLAITISLLPLAALGDNIGYRRVYLGAARRRARAAGFWRCRHHEREFRADPLHLSAEHAGPRPRAQHADGGDLG